MSIKEKFKNLSQEDKKLVLYKFAEIYSDSDELLDFMDNLKWDEVNSVFDIIFAWNEKERENLWNKEDEKFKKLLGKINELGTKINTSIVQEKELLNKSKEQKDFSNIDNLIK